MKFGTKHSPAITSCTAVHVLPGRIRIRTMALSYLESQVKDISWRISQTEGVTKVDINPLSKSILVLYNTDLVVEEALIESIEYIISTYSISVYREHRAELNRLPVSERRVENEPIEELLTRIAITTASIAFSIIRPKPVATGLLRRLISISSLSTLSLSFPIIKNGAQSLITSKRPNADTLSATSIFASLLLGKPLSAMTIILLADLAELITAFTMNRTRKAIGEMLSIGEPFVWKKTGEDSQRIPLAEIQSGDEILVHTGEKISVDGELVSGYALVDQSPITGEFMPVQKESGEAVYAGTLVKNGECVIRAEKVGDKTAAGRIIHLVEQASHHKADVQTFADKVSAYFIPVNFGLAVLVWLITRNVDRALSMLIIDYSCGVRLSTVTAISSSIAAAAKNGVLIKGGNYIEMLSSIDTIVLDKTGTITKGKPDVTSVYPFDMKLDEKRIIELAAAAEERSTHPMAHAVIGYARKNGYKIPKHGELKTILGRGVETQVGNRIVRVGNRRYMQESGIDVDNLHEVLLRMARRGEQVIFVAGNKKLLGVIGVQDSLRDNMKKALNRLRNSGFDDIMLLTGDVEQQAEVVAERIRVDSFLAEVLPENKSDAILKMQSRGIPVIMVGDGINDAPALAYADVGISMGSSRTDIAMEAADITIIQDDPMYLPGIIRLSNRTMDIVKQNFVTAIGINSAALVLSTLGFLPVFWGAVFHNATTVGVVLNSTRLLFHNMESR